MFTEHGNEADMLLTYADQAMYKAKEEGRNRVCFFSHEQKAQAESRLVWKKNIQNALQNNQFELYLQPILHIGHNTISNYEALLRMRDENGEIITPDKFLNIAESYGLILKIDQWVVRNAIRLIAESRLINKELQLSINISGKSLTNPELLSLIQQELVTSAINPENLIIEITETDVTENMAAAQHFINTLKTVGCRFALDDFGVGFSSFNYLRNLSVDYLKIDGSFILNLPYSNTDQHLVKAIVEVARGIGTQVIAEFVHSEEALLLLHKLGVHYAQGYYLGRPVEVSEILGSKPDDINLTAIS